MRTARLQTGNRTWPHIVRQIVRDSGQMVAGDFDEPSVSVKDGEVLLIQEGTPRERVPCWRGVGRYLGGLHATVWQHTRPELPLICRRILMKRLRLLHWRVIACLF